MRPKLCPEVRLPAQLAVADVRLALHALRYAWYEDMTPETPFLFSATALSETAGGEGRLSMAEFGCLFDYAQHIKRHHRLVPRKEANKVLDPKHVLARIKEEAGMAPSKEMTPSGDSTAPASQLPVALRARAILRTPSPCAQLLRSRTPPEFGVLPEPRPSLLAPSLPRSSQESPLSSPPEPAPPKKRARASKGNDGLPTK